MQRGMVLLLLCHCGPLTWISAQRLLNSDKAGKLLAHVWRQAFPPILHRPMFLAPAPCLQRHPH